MSWVFRFARAAALGITINVAQPTVAVAQEPLVLDAAAIAESGARTLAELLAARIPGVSVTWLSGAPGIASHVSIRGAVGGTGSGRPELIVDGVLMRDDEYWLSARPDGGHRLAHHWNLPTAEIERVEVVLGASGGIALDNGAPKGAVLVTTSRPRADAWAGRFRVNTISPGAGSAIPAMTTRTGNLTAGGTTNYCTLALEADGSCTPTGTRTQAPFANGAPFERGFGVQIASSGSGRALGGFSRLGVVLERNDGQLGGTQLRADVAAAYDREITPRLRLESVARVQTLDFDFLEYADYRTRAAIARYPDDAGYQPLPTLGDVQLDATAEVAFRALARVGLALRLADQDQLALSLAHERLDRSVDRTPLAYYGSDADRGTSTIVATYRRIRGAESGLRRELRAGATARELTHEESNGPTSTSLTMSSGNAYLSYRLAHAARRSVELGVRRDWIEGGEDLNAFSEPLKFAAARWRISAEPLLAPFAQFGEFTLRGAYGESTDQQSLIDAILVANVMPSAERVQERDAGLEFTSPGKSWRASARWFGRDVRGGHVRRALAATSGFAETLDPNVPTRSFGSELSVEWRKALGASTTMDLSGWVGRSKSRFGATPLLASFGIDGPGGTLVSSVYAGAPYGNLVEPILTIVDANDDGVITNAEVTLAGSRLRYSAPTNFLGASLRLRGAGGWSAGGTLDGKGGHYRASRTDFLRCIRSLCEEKNEPGSSLAEQARAAVGAWAIRDASFVRVRELWIRREFDTSGSSSFAVSLIAQNLLTFSRYPDDDPEATVLYSPGVLMGENGQQPIAPSVSLRVDWGRR